MHFTHLIPFVSLALASPIASPSTPALAAREVTTVTISGSVATSYPQAASPIPGYPVHSSCNGTERAQLNRALGEAIQLAQQAVAHVLAHGNSSALFTKYFGTAPVAEVIGWFEKVVYGNREGVLFRCDDIDGNCALPAWGGHWRGSNATLETVICPLSYTTRRPLEAMCGQGYTVANGALNTFFAADLLHRLYHVTSIGDGVVEHYADSYAECLELAEHEPEEAVRNTHSLQYFALDVWAMEVTLPGEGCTGRTATSAAAPAATSSVASNAAAVVSSTMSTVATSTAVATSAQAAVQTSTSTSSAAAECHTHADGVVHCV